ncbi:MAG TPA: sigma-70 family RNA polymerase sigma factor [Solirubrobacterales bacterium]|nr:sigma-70 family RNA polymerase sigma factor [Solirubrobacterales bacterium]
MPSLREVLQREELEAAERSFEQLLRRKRFSPAFLDRHAADLLAKARLEYSQYVAGGGEVRNPAGWIIHCAWRRTQNLLEQEGRAPRVISIDNGTTFANESATPEEEVLTSDRYCQLQVALEQLPPEERKVIVLTYFEGMSVREVGRTLKWDKCKADRRHRAALERLQELLGVKDIDALQIEIGIIAWASIAAGDQARTRLPAGVEAVIDSVAAVVGRGQELARRLLAGGAAEPGMAPAIGGAARTAGVCGAAAVACMATGLVGPGVSGVDVLADQRREPAVERHTAPLEPTGTATAQPETAESLGAMDGGETNAREDGDRKQATSKPMARTQKTQRASTPRATATPSQVSEEFDPFTGGGETPSSGATTSGGGSTTSQPPSSTGGNSSPPPAASGKQVESEFGL